MSNKFNSGLAQYSCDYCKQRKLKCSRELPSCQNCKAWNEGCTYSRHGKIRRRPRSHVIKSKLAVSSTTTSEVSSPHETSNSQPTNKDHELASNEAGRYEDSSDSESSQASGRLLNDETGQSFYIGPSPIATFLSQAATNVDKVIKDVQDERLQKKAEDSLADLSATFASVSFHDASEIRKKVQASKRNSEVFFIPEKEEGLYLMDVFLERMGRVSPFFRVPPDELMPRIVFEPTTVTERGWLLLFNATVSTDLALMDPPNMRLSRSLQWNAWTILEDSSIFLEPSEIRIQALLLLAAHGQEIATPTLCWTLMTHACQMAQTLALHLPLPRTPSTSSANHHRLCLFWGLFVVDKALSLSVGRPPLLPAYLYRNVPPLNPATVSRSQPDSQEVGDLPVLSDFDHPLFYGVGGFYISQNIELAKLQGRVSDLMYSDGKTNTLKITELKNELDTWMENLLASAFHELGMRPSTTTTIPPRDHEKIRLRVNVLKFQYHHLIVFLTRGDKNSEISCLSSARAAISLLEHLVSNSCQVFNGIIWQLLYQPFTPYFVLFSHVVSNPTLPTCFKDLQSLRKVVLYFLQMNNNHPSSAKLETIAETFTKLAETYVRHARQREQRPAKQQLPTVALTVPNNKVPPLLSDPNAFSEYSSYPSSDQSTLPPLPPLDPRVSSEVDFNDMPTDPITLLNFFNPSFESTITTGSEPQGLAMGETEAVFKELKTFEQNGALDGTFDWFSWDLYDTSMS